MTSVEAGARRPPVVLLASTMLWPFSARVAMAFAELGWRVEAVCPSRNPMACTRVVSRVHRYGALRPISALSRAMAKAAPDLVIPCDERALAHLRALGQSRGNAAERARAGVIARSIGEPWTAEDPGGRAALIELARREGVRAPLTLAADTMTELRSALDRIGVPAMLKVDGTWGGTGVAKVESRERAEQGFARMRRKASAMKAIKQLMVDRDPFWLLPWLRRTPPRVNAQAFVTGRPANCLVSCRDGKILAIIQVEVLCAVHALGPAMTVRVARNAEMSEAARLIVARCRLSGFCGFDFMIDDADGAVHLIEMNQRITPLAHLNLGDGRDPVAALAVQYTGLSEARRKLTTDADVITLYPQGWWLDPGSPELLTGYQDVPCDEPALVRELKRQSRQKPGWFIRLIRERNNGRRQPFARWRQPARLCETDTPAPCAKASLSIQAEDSPVRDMP